ncbi:class I SAM-dependent methyltransferase [Patescibacteria group bacterium]|nr:class I SAM-dependent methyltransferase [Patescibacteria group bacterium]MBU1028883.1 class I SAM-dependent methyltransferase [Patescibacteria group bacterium]MBU1916320.1 class I SAM-dependent methyltransferase [Patescibacteria group bacterium]
MAGQKTELKREVADWQDYELLDSGDQMKCERFGAVTVVRPEPQALWSPARFDVWQQAAARFNQQGDDGSWQVTLTPPIDWKVNWEDLCFGLRLSSFKHTGLFPEQAINWSYLRAKLKPKAQLLNLFGYTGGVTLAGLSVGAAVVHVDASRPAIAAAKNNAELSGLADRPVRWIEDDVTKFVEREVRRKRVYDGIIMDPPAFGRGPNKELWYFETGLLPLLRLCRKILSPGGYLLVNAYSLGWPAVAVEQVVSNVFQKVQSLESIELVLPEKTERGFVLPAGITVRAII